MSINDANDALASGEDDVQAQSCTPAAPQSGDSVVAPAGHDSVPGSSAENESPASADNMNSNPAVDMVSAATSNPNTDMSMNIENNNDGSVSDENAAEVTSADLTSETAAASASANLNAGTDVAAPPDTTMNTYTIKNSLAPVGKGKPSFTAIRNNARSAGSISLNYSKGNPSNSGDVHPSINRNCYHDGTSVVSASGSVDDSVSITAPGISYTSSSGAAHGFSVVGSSVPAGYYSVSVTHSNIASHPAGNVSLLTGSIGPISERGIIPDENEEVTCDACSCGGSGNNNGGNGNGNSRSIENTVIYPFETSSGGSGVVRTANARHMRFAFDFGSFRGMGSISAGQPEIVAFAYADSLLTPAALTFKHPLASVVVPQGDTVDANELFRVFDGASYTNYMVMGDGSRAFGVGATDKKSEQVHFVTAVSKAASVECNLNDADVAYIRVASADGSAVFYDIETNKFAAYITEDDGIVLADEKLSIVRNADGSIRQIWNYWDGLADVVPASNGNGFTISLYLPNQISAPVAEGSLFTFSGEPFKTFTVSGDAVAQSLTVREHDLSLPESMPDYVTSWTRVEAGWNLAIGEGEDIITETREKSLIADSDNYQIVTTRSQGGVVASRVAEVFSSTAHGELCLSRTEAYGTDYAQTTTFEYDEAGRQVRRIAPDGGEYTTVYDNFGRVTVERSPWAGGQFHVMSTTYREASSYNSDPAMVEESVVAASGNVIVLRTDVYTYTEADHVRRVEIRSTAAGSSVTQLKVEETWLATADNIYARGRTKMTQAVNGVQTVYSYAGTTAYGALYSVTRETRVNDAAVNSHSRRMVEYISASGNVMRTEEYALLYNGTWVQLSGVTNTYDVKNRLVGTTKDTGRTTSRTLTCTGAPLTETDEDGITTTYGYNTTRQLVEVIRAEVKDGETVITPETITTYTRDAAGRTLSVRKDVGAMTTIETTEYDLMGRVMKRTDVLGRVTTTAYSADGLTTTVTQPNGATLITTRNTDGSTAHAFGTGQQELYYAYGLQEGNRFECVKLADNETIISQQVVNGFDEVITEASATTTGFVYTCHQYDAEGKLVRTQQDDGTAENAMSPTIYSYDQFGNVVRKTLVLADEPDASNSRLTITTRSMVQREDGIYRMVTTTHNNSAGVGYNSSTATLVSELSATLESKTIVTDPRGKDSTSWTERGTGAIRTQKQQIPTSNIVATARVVDGFVVSQTDTVGISTTQSRCYTATGMTLTQTNGRGNATTTVTDLAGRTVSMTDATNATTTTVYEATSDNPATITNAQGKTSCYRYDLRGRKVAEFGTAIQPACFGYDDADRLVSLTTFRADEGDISTDPTERSDGDTTCWAYDPASGLELSKTYADNSCITKTYDSFGRLATETNARGMVKTLSYVSTTGELSGMVFADDAAPAQAFTYTLTGKLASVSDAAGERVFTYNEYDELVSDCLTADEILHLITENRDAFGRSIGFDYAKAGSAASSEQYGYGTDGRLATAAFSHGGESKSFGFSYLAGSGLLQTLTMPNGMTLTQQYEENRDLLTGMLYKRGTSGVVERYYSYDTLGRPLTRQQNRQGGSRSDTFMHNDRSELTSATIGSDSYAYAYDNIGNRKTAQENAEEVTNYDANALNQYTAVGDFVPEFDADGNQTKVQTSTGIWDVTYNAENRPTMFSRVNEDGTTTRVSCAYDYMGRRATKKVETITTNTETAESTATTTLHQRYLYRGYLQIACCDLTRENHPHLWLITWDPTQPVATRPLAIRKDGTWYCYGWDLTKNVCEVFSNEGRINNTVIYSYTPYGAVSAEGSITQPIQWSSEFYDDELGLVYYIYRHFNPIVGRWLRRDVKAETGGLNLYAFSTNSPLFSYDHVGAQIVFASNCQCLRSREVIQEQFDIAKSALNQAISELNPQSSKYKRFFGKYSKQRHKIVSKVINEMTRIINNATIHVSCGGAECEESVLAYVYITDGQYKVYICPDYYSMPDGNTFEGKANTILHELAHEVEMPAINLIDDKEAPWYPNTQPYGAPYGLDYAEWIAIHDAWTAITNAENYAAYLATFEN